MTPDNPHNSNARSLPGSIAQGQATQQGPLVAVPIKDEIRIVGKIGTDPEQLKLWADRVVVDKVVIKDHEIADLRLLIEEIQRHPAATLVTDRAHSGGNTVQRAGGATTALEIRDGRIIRADCGPKSDETRGLEIRIVLSIHSEFVGPAKFGRATFAETAEFIGSRFTAGGSWLSATFSGPARFDGSQFGGPARFDGTKFCEYAAFDGSTFTDEVHFSRAHFERNADFGACKFSDLVKFELAVFGGNANFEVSHLYGKAQFDGATFGQLANFSAIRCLRETTFFRAAFNGQALFVDAASTNEILFYNAVFSSYTSGDFRSLTVRDSSASLKTVDDRYRFRVMPVDSALQRALALFKSYACHGWLGWSVVRSLGGLHILNRVSLIALLAIPLLAAVYVALRELVGRQSSHTGPTPILYGLIERTVGNDPHLSASLALTFFASAFVTMGLLVYQVFAEDTVKEKTEAEHVRDVDTRYPEKTDQRNDGLRRSLERLEDQAKVRRNTHPNFVHHHGDLIWMPPRNRIEWFDDRTLPRPADLTKLRESVKASQRGVKEPPPIMTPQSRDGFLPGAERARICIEEGAKAEYWLLSHKRVWAAWISFLLYLAGIGCILWVLGLQCHKVGQAAGWWGQPVAVVAPPPPAPQ